jgi:nitroimidazol reductase NimA-like FMN-containing flavoprotein (pyridoxamine 5'-phosphate oxidase superfamily)
MADKHNRRAAEIISRILYITIASVSGDGRPWNTPVYSAFDKDLNFYWASDKHSQHSQNIRAAGNVFLVVYDSTVPEGTGEGVYFQATAQELNKKDEVLAALQALDSRVGKAQRRDFANYSGDAVLRVYQATPQQVWMNDADEDASGNYIRDARVEVPIEVLKKQVA